MKKWNARERTPSLRELIVMPENLPTQRNPSCPRKTVNRPILTRAPQKYLLTPT
jgi:hypothetical protein